MESPEASKKAAERVYRFLQQYPLLLNLSPFQSNFFLFPKLDSKKKLSRQLEYASKRGLSLAIICGENEFNNNTITIKNLRGIKGENQISIPKEKLVNEIKKFL